MSADMDGETLQRLAYSTEPIEPKGLALAVVVIMGILLVLCSVVLLLRLFVRAWMMRKVRGWAWDDTFAILAYGTFVCSAVFNIRAAHYGLGTRDANLTPLLMIRAAEYMLYASVMYGFSMPFVKAVILFTLLPITTQAKYRWTLYAMMAIIGILASLLYCRPVRAYWNPLLGTCGDFMVVVNIGYAWTAVGIITDIGFATVPFFIVRKLQMSPRTKVTVTVILSFGVVACIATIIRAPYLQYYLVPTDRLYWNGHINMWCLLETGIAMIATNLTPLRTLFMRYLQNKDPSSKRSGYEGGSSANSHALASLGRRGERSQRSQQDDLMITVAGEDIEARPDGGSNSSLEIADDSSSKAIVQHTVVYVTHEPTSSKELAGTASRE